ncbi:hypothetical protein C8F04DRAFT_1106082 [Mycena alexandri]|uniref:DUF6534 domain-containing protein n=1 Tax=Mycena alexandri TaxID=1745969 RepID=A0AAD6SMS5_9AGAR|nr:hypothetical protein C8F04DRAFT_1115515 [Mycena alexandri]KAJ7032888.1 hypothetical protein C8F04DRAFT_1106082 [Mycena alexandri]
MPSVQTTSLTPNYGELITPNLFAELLTFFFAGTFIAQAWIYYVLFPRDSRGVKVYVSVVCLLTVLFLCSNTVDVYTWYAASYGNIEGFLESHDKNYSSSIGAAMSVLLVQIFFCHRIVLIKRAAWPFALAIVLLAIVQCAAGLALGILFRLGATEVDNSRHALSRHFNEATIIACVVNAILVSAVTSYVLLSAAVVPSTRNMLKNVVFLIIETNTVTAIVALVAAVLYAVFPATSYSLCPFGILPTLYVNSFFASLNYRAISSARSSDVCVDSESLSILDPNPQSGCALDSIAGTGGESIASMSFAPRRSEDLRRARGTSTLDSGIAEVRRSQARSEEGSI